MKIGDLFQRPIERRVNEVVQVEDVDEAEVLSEINEYVITDQISGHFVRLLEQHYLERNTRDTAIWISGFFGSGKSLFLKLLCEILAQDTVAGISVIETLIDAGEDPDFKRSLAAVKNGKPALVLAMHMKSEAFGDASIVNMLWRRLHQAFGYCRVPWVAEIERSLEVSGLRSAFEERIAESEGRPWKELQQDGLLRVPVLAKALTQVDARYGTEKSAEAAIKEAKETVQELQTPLRFTERCLQLLSEHPEYARIFWGLDEMGQFAADRTDLLLELGTIVEEFSSKGKGKLWLAATAQEKLDAVVANYPKVNEMVAKIKDRFPRGLRVELTNENAEVVVRERLLRKRSDQQQILREFLAPHAPWLLTEPVLKGLKYDYRVGELEAVVASYPFLPAHFQVITDFMQGLARDTGGTADRTARGPRALIGVTQDVARALAPEPLGKLVRLEDVYAQMVGSIPSEDADVITSVDQAGGAPDGTRGVLETTYVLDAIGVDRLPATALNIAHSSLGEVGVSGPALERGVSESLDFLSRRTFVREVGLAENLTYRFLKAYQRKIEDEVRQQNPTATAVQAKARHVVRQALTQFSGSKASYKAVRTFSLAFPVDGEFTPEKDVVVSVYSPMGAVRDKDVARNKSVAEHQPVWLMNDLADFYEEVRVLVGTGDVLNQRRSKATTEEERSQIRRAEEDAEGREERLLSKAVAALRDGTIYVEGIEVATASGAGDAIVTAVVQEKYPSLARAAVAVSEKDLDGVFASPRPVTGPLTDLGLLFQGKLSDGPELTQAALASVKNLAFKGGASGASLQSELEKAPYGYAPMQVRLALSVLCAMGKLRALAPGGKVVPLGAGLELRLRNTNEFRNTVFEAESDVDPAQLSAVAGLLQQRFGKKIAMELPAIATAARTVCNSLQAQILQVETLVRLDIPQVSVHLSSLKNAVQAVVKSSTDAGVVAAMVNNQESFEKWQSTLKPLEDQLNADSVEVIEQARKLTADNAVEILMPDATAQLRNLLDGPHPWQDLKDIKRLRGSIAAKVEGEVAKLHTRLSQEVEEIETEVRVVASALQITGEPVESALHDAQALVCPGYQKTSLGRCARCHGGLQELRDRIDALPLRRTKILSALEAAAAKVGGGGPSPAKWSVRERMGLPKTVGSRNEVVAFVQDLQDQLERLVDEYGSGTITS
jgi:hypothetical protein